jgi:deazaflavin-dependent oxidoreductase (nitroreductase family)
MPDPADFENALIADMRAHDGRVTSGPLEGHPLLILTMTGAKSGEPRRALLTWSRDGDAYVVAGTAGGSTTTPAWVHNIEANPDVRIEVGNQEVSARASIAPEAERQTLWDHHLAALPWFAAYPEQVQRPIPMIRITPVTSD